MSAAEGRELEVLDAAGGSVSAAGDPAAVGVMVRVGSAGAEARSCHSCERSGWETEEPLSRWVGCELESCHICRLPERLVVQTGMSTAGDEAACAGSARATHIRFDREDAG